MRGLTQHHTRAWPGRRGQGYLDRGRYKAFLVQDDANLAAPSGRTARWRTATGGRRS